MSRRDKKAIEEVKKLLSGEDMALQVLDSLVGYVDNLKKKRKRHLFILFTCAIAIGLFIWAAGATENTVAFGVLV